MKIISKIWIPNYLSESICNNSCFLYNIILLIPVKSININCFWYFALLLACVNLIFIKFQIFFKIRKANLASRILVKLLPPFRRRILWIISWILISPYFRSSCIYPWYRGTHERAWNNKVGGAEERFLSLK